MKCKVARIEVCRSSFKTAYSISVVSGKLEATDETYFHDRERKVLSHFSHEARKLSYGLGRIAAKQAVIKLEPSVSQGQIWVDSGVFQFPILRCPGVQNIQVTISHCENIAVSIAFPEEHPMGIDIVRHNEAGMNALDGQLNFNEIQLIRAKFSNQQIGKISIFSIKEALSKILKTGMMLDFAFLEIDKLDLFSTHIEATFYNFPQYKAYAITHGNLTVSYVLPKRSVPALDHISVIHHLIADQG